MVTTERSQYSARLVGAEGTQPQDQQPELAYEDPRFSQMWLVLERPTSMDRVAPPTG